ncbi:acyltransferase [Mesorhizobium sp. L-8-10]|uniref:acyltransferase family protein n=1 Tax=unclassified Mesorhizobium TaxID=325217 RepID=UPI001925D231|nr:MULTISPECIES: acyltransferase [unclassified Mesorhizobium]BCH27360.1 acyltransferase [Mesorhizobium sp. L-8-3]BCH35317.1 acyltransferase [Mesorhizobium sp. L-8-10]
MVQVLRALAAMAVVFQHARARMTDFDGQVDFLPFDHGAQGVDLFFVISGFIMVWVTKDGAVAPLTFIKRRFFRVWPLYVLVTLVAALLSFLAPRYYSGSTDLIYIIKSAFFIPAFRPSDGNLFPIMVPGWSLNLEVVFYVIFGLSFFLRSPYFVACAAVSALYLISSQFDSVGPLMAAYGGRNAIILEFVVGVLVGIAYIKGARIPQITAYVLMAFGFYLLIARNQEGLIGAGIPAAFIVFAAINIDLDLGERTNRVVDLLGRVSFALYLIHNFVIQGSTRVLLDYGIGAGELNGWVYFVLVALLSLGASLTIYRYIEAPMTKFLTSPLRRAWQPSEKPVPLDESSEKATRLKRRAVSRHSS